MQKILIVLLLGTASSLFAVSQSTKIKELEQRIEKLEKAMKPILVQQKAKGAAKKLQIEARTRMKKDIETYSQEELRKIESLYQSRGYKWGSRQKNNNLRLLISTYPKSNRAGCAMLYLGQSSKGKIQEDYLKQAIEKYSDCFYGNGVQVGPYAKFYLAMVYKRSGKKDQATALFDEIKTESPDAIDHRQRNLVSMIKQIFLESIYIA